MVCLLSGALASCTFLPAEFNLSPIYRHRLDDNGEVLELDILWPVIHYEQTADGGSDFRIRPLWRWLTRPPELGAEHRGTVQEHQFLWPFGRVASDDIETSSRLFPLWWHRAREGEDGQREYDWYALFPFLWGGGSEDGSEDYLALFPIYADIPEFLLYDRFTAVLFPLYLGLEKQGQTMHQVLWPLIGWSNDPTPQGRKWLKLLPFFTYDLDPQRYERRYAPWPLIHWGREKLWTDDPTHTLWFWPFYGQQRSDTVDSWTVAWPLFQHTYDAGRYHKVNVLWPFYQSLEDADQDNLEQWWLWPLVARTETDHQWAWNFLWPLVWISRYDDPEGVQRRQWVVPFYANVERQYRDGGEDTFTRYWPFFHHGSKRDGTSAWNLLSPWPYRDGMAYGIEEAYGWLWTLARGWSRSADDHAVELMANIYTSRTRRTAAGTTRSQGSVPLLFSWDGDDDGGVFRLFQFIPIPYGGSDPATGSGGDS